MTDNTSKPHDKAPPAPPPQTPPQGQVPADPSAAPPAEAEMTAEEREARFRSSRGAQVILDPESDASLGARGGAGGDIEANQAVRDAGLEQAGLDPRDPDATHLPRNLVPSGGPVMDQVGVDKVREPTAPPDAPDDAAAPKTAAKK